MEPSGSMCCAGAMSSPYAGARSTRRVCEETYRHVGLETTIEARRICAEVVAWAEIVQVVDVGD